VLRVAVLVDAVVTFLLALVLYARRS